MVVCVYVCLAVMQSVSNYWPEGMSDSKSYRCNTTKTLHNGNDGTRVTMSDMLVEAFQTTDQAKFSNPGL